MSEGRLIRCKKSAHASPTHLTSPRVRDSQLATTPHLAATETSIIVQNKKEESGEHETPDLSTRLERAKRFGHNLGQVSVANRSAQLPSPAYPIGPKMIQCRLKIGRAGDKYEQEADRVAEQVMAMNALPKPDSIQRQGEEQDEPQALQTKPLAASITPPIQHQAQQDKPVQEEEEEDKQVLQAKEILGHSPEANLDKQLRLQPIDEEEDKETLQAKELRLQPLDEEQEQSAQVKELSDRTPEVSPNKELGLQPPEEKRETEPVQAKQLSDRAPFIFPSKELRLQPVEEQEEAEPLQAKELLSLTPEFSLNKELQQQPLETANPVIQAKALFGGFTPSPLSIQRGVSDWLSKGWNKTKDVVGAGVEKGRDLLNSGLDWVKNNIIQPLMGLASSGWNAVKNFGSQIATAFQQANPNIWDVFLPQHLVFRVASNQRKQLFAQAIQAERSQQAQAAAGI